MGILFASSTPPPLTAIQPGVGAFGFAGQDITIPVSGVVGNPWDLPTADVNINITSPFTAAKFQAAINSVPAGDGLIYQINCPVASTLAPTGTALTTNHGDNKNVVIKYNGCGLDMSAAGASTFSWVVDYLRVGDRVSVNTVVISTVTYSQITFLDLSAAQVASLYPAGTVLHIYSNARYYGDITAARRHGEIMVVLQQSGTSCALYVPSVQRLGGSDQTILNYQFPSANQGGGTPYGAGNDPRVAKFNSSSRLWLDQPRAIRTQSNTGTLHSLQSLYMPVVRNPNVSQFADAAWQWIDCYKGYLTDPNIHDGNIASPNGYAMQILGKDNRALKTTSGAFAQISACRHSWDATGISPGVTTAAAASANVRFFGSAFYNIESGINITAMKSSAIAQHSQSDQCTTVGCPSDSPPTLSTYYRTVRGKDQTMDGTPPFGDDGVHWIGGRTVVKYGRMLQLYCYCCDPTTGGGSLNPDGYWLDGSNVIAAHYDFHCLSGGSSMIDCAPGPTAGAPNGYRYMRIVNCAYFDIRWFPEGSSSRCNHSGRGDWFSSGNQLIYGNVFCNNFYNLTKPNPTTDPYGSGDPYPSSLSTWNYLNEVIDLSGLSTVGAQTLTIWSVGANCTVTGNADIFNKPANITLINGTGKAGAGSTGGLSVTVH